MSYDIWLFGFSAVEEAINQGERRESIPFDIPCHLRIFLIARSFSVTGALRYRLMKLLDWYGILSKFDV